MMTLPLFINRKNIWKMALVSALVFFLGYSIPNHFHLFEPQTLLLTEWDRSIPLMPWTIFVYISEYIFFVCAYFLFRGEETRNKYVWSFFGVTIFAAFIFIFFPTTYPRHDYPVPADTHAIVAYAFQVLRTLDNPSNCFPSMHVTCCLLTAFAFFENTETRPMRLLFLVWSLLITVSTLPTKQHYIVDLIGGLVLASFGYWVFFKKVRYVPLEEYRKQLDSILRLPWS